MEAGGQVSVLVELLPALLGVGLVVAIPMLLGVFLTPARPSAAISGLAIGALVSGYLPMFFVNWLWKSGNDVGAALIGELSNLAYPLSVLLGLASLAFRIRRMKQYP
nr:hypothetical protein [Mesorhizobium sp.]